jgi:4'-phosphopantetheinyl transferase
VAALRDLRPQQDRFMALLDAAESARADRFRFAEDRERFILGHGMLRTVLAPMLGARPEELVFERGPHGKPYLPSGGPRFSFSDTKDAVLIGVAGSTELGVDLETMARSVDHDAVARHYFTDPEVSMLDALQGHDRKLGFLELWTRKEAVLKATGVGIMEDLRSMSVLERTNAMRITHPEMMRMAEPDYHVRTWVIGGTHIASLAAPEALDAEWREFRP